MDETEILRQELEHYKLEKERIRKIIGQIGGNTSKKKDNLINIFFLALVCLFIIQMILTETSRTASSIEIKEGIASTVMLNISRMTSKKKRPQTSARKKILIRLSFFFEVFPPI